MRLFGEFGFRDFAGIVTKSTLPRRSGRPRRRSTTASPCSTPPNHTGRYISEELLGKALGTRRKEIVLVTKVGFKYDGNRLVNQCSAFDHVITAAEGCLRRLGTDWVT